MLHTCNAKGTPRLRTGASEVKVVEDELSRGVLKGQEFS